MHRLSDNLLSDKQGGDGIHGIIASKGSQEKAAMTEDRATASLLPTVLVTPSIDDEEEREA